MAWTNERVEQLKALWGAGKSASQIAASIGGVSRNAVIGKAHRLGLSNRSHNSGGAPTPVAQEEVSQVKQQQQKKKKVRSKTEREKPQTSAPKTNGSKSPAAAAPVTPAVPPAPHLVIPPMAVERAAATAGETPGAEEAASNPVLAIVAETERNARKLSLLELNERTCKWPIGDPATNNFYFCGLSCTPGKPYCAAHVALAYQPMSTRRDRNKGRAASA